MVKVVVLGKGAFGVALGGVLSENGCSVYYYDSLKEKQNLSALLDRACYVVLCVPSSVAPYLIPHLPKEKTLIVATKGFLSETPFKDFKKLIVISGPGFASDIEAKKPTCLTVTSTKAIKMFNTDYLDIDVVHDTRGVLMCGALKNVYAIMAGFLGLTPGEDDYNAFLDSVVCEMKFLLKINGAKPGTVDHCCGKDDLRLTCDIPSRNYQFGRKLADNPNARPECTVEGISTIKRIRRGEIVVPKEAEILKEILNVTQC